MIVGVIGGGTVGRATARCYLEFVEEVRVYDSLPERSTHGCEETTLSDLVFVCLPEKQLGNYFSAVKDYPDAQDVPFVVRSTVPVGTCRTLQHFYGLKSLAHSPEFLTARCAQADARLPSQLIVGGPGNRATHRLYGLYSKRFPGTSIMIASWEESEFIKLALNSFFAVKVAFFNEIEEYCRRTNLEYEVVRTAILGDGRVTAHHTLVPGPDGFKGFGGACLPKDLRHLIDCLQRANLQPHVTFAALRRNDRDRLRDSPET